jgi:hypothetical protein
MEGSLQHSTEAVIVELEAALVEIWLVVSYIAQVTDQGYMKDVYKEYQYPLSKDGSM